MSEQAKDNALALERHINVLEAELASARLTLERLKGDVGVERPPSVRPVVERAAYSFGGEDIKAGVDRDPLKLLKPFADKVEVLFQRLRDRGLDPMLWEGYRSPERAQKLSDKGAGIRLSLHCLGAACDIIEREAHWAASDDFWDALGEEAESLGLVWGGRWKRRDKPHVQAIAVRDQDRFRRMTDEERLAFISGQPGWPASSSSS